MYPYQDRNTFFHRLHPVTKLLALILFITIAFFARDLVASLIVLVSFLALLLAVHGGPNLMKFWKLLVLFWVFVFIAWIVMPALRDEPWSFQNSAMLANRIDSFVLASLIFVTVSRIEEFTYALTRIGIPYKGAFALSLGFRLVPLFYQNLQTIVEAQKSRGLDVDSVGIRQKGKLYLPILGILISYGIRNADIMAMALEARGFGYDGPRTSYLQPVISYRDIVVLGGAAMIVFFQLQ